MKRKCIMCGVRPVWKGAYCAQCHGRIEANTRTPKVVLPVAVVHYHGVSVAAMPTGKTDGKVWGGQLCRFTLQRGSVPRTVPVIDLDHYCEGFTPDQVKRLKKAVKVVAEYWDMPLEAPVRSEPAPAPAPVTSRTAKGVVCAGTAVAMASAI